MAFESAWADDIKARGRRRKRTPEPIREVSLANGFTLELETGYGGKRTWILDGYAVSESRVLEFAKGLEAALIKAYFRDMPLPEGWVRL